MAAPSRATASLMILPLIARCHDDADMADRDVADDITPGRLFITTG